MRKDAHGRPYRTLRHDGLLRRRHEENAVAHAMKEWAISKGATHYAHWFQPLSGITSEKHDSFLEPNHDGTA
ncbi:glutamine synthetase III, partial [Collinsella intestinalis]|uniref:glutamine synthetase III n=1 Tax=Collinsella intestinalis TaxID=147207 RepID=UPI0022E205CC